MILVKVKNIWLKGKDNYSLPMTTNPYSIFIANRHCSIK